LREEIYISLKVGDYQYFNCPHTREKKILTSETGNVEAHQISNIVEAQQKATTPSSKSSQKKKYWTREKSNLS